MDFFVKGRGESPSPQAQDNDLNNFEIELLAIGKKIGLSFAELNELRVTDLFAMAEIYSGRKGDKPRAATQVDIDAFYGG